MRGQTALLAPALRMPSAPGALEIHRNRRPRAANLGQANHLSCRDRTSCRWLAFRSQHPEGRHGGGRHLAIPKRTTAAIARDREDHGRHAMQFGVVADLIVGCGLFTAFERTGYQTCQAVDIIEERAARLADSPLPFPAKLVREMNIVEE